MSSSSLASRRVGSGASSSSSSSQASPSPPPPPPQLVPPSAADNDQVKQKAQRNEKGGVFIDRDELKITFDHFDTTGKGYITKQDLKEHLPLFYRHLKPKEYQYLMNKQNKLTFDDLYDLLAENELLDFDPVEEAFSFYDPRKKGRIEPQIIAKFLNDLGLGPITDDDLQILIKCVGGDENTTSLTLEQFRKMLDFDFVNMADYVESKAFQI